jgi:hypothetical protein
MATGTATLYRAQARCGCGWKGERHSGTKREPQRSLAHADDARHRQATGHTDVGVETWWTGTCRGCKVSSGRCQHAQQAWAWVTHHQAEDPRHLRRQRNEQEWSDTADRIIGAIRF